MNTPSIKATYLFLIASCFLSCNGQTKQGSSVSQPIAIGQVAHDLDEQIWAIFQDRKGSHWFGSNGKGVYRFDGQELKLFTTSDGLVHDQVRGIQEDMDGNIYIETPEGVSKYDGMVFTTLEVRRSPNNQWRLEPQDLWFNCNGNADHVYRYDGEVLHELQLPRQDLRKALGIHEFETSYSPYTVFGIDKDRSGNLWLGTLLAGAFRYDGESFLWVGEKELSRLPDGREPGVRSILQDSDGNIWPSNFYSKYRIDTTLPLGYEKLEAVELSKELEEEDVLYFNSGIADNEGNLWMTTYGGGVWKYDGQTLSYIEISNGAETVLLISIYQDKDGTLWLGTNNDGVYKQSEEGFKKFMPASK